MSGRACPDKFKAIIFLSAILIITFIAFLPCLKNGFVNWDDDFYVTLNPLIKDLSFKGVFNIFTTAHRGLYKPLVLLSFAVEYYFFNLNPAIYHSTNLILHLINCLLVFGFFYFLGERLEIAFIAALLFGIHPLHVESVAWVTERKDLLYSFFLLTAAIFYLYYLKGRIKKFYWCSLTLFTLSFLAKPMGITFPLVMMAFDYYLGVKNDRKSILEKMPFFIIAFLFLIISLLTTNKFIHHQSSFNAFDSIFIASYGFVFYLSKLFIPLNLSCLYPYPVKINNVLPWVFLISPFLVISLAMIVVVSCKYTKKILLAAVLFFCPLLPVIQLVPSGPAIAADRYSYISSIGLFYLIGLAIVWFYGRIILKKAGKMSFSAFIVFIFAVLIFLTYNRCKVWKDGTTLWDDALRKYPGSAIIYNNRGVAYSDYGKHDTAISSYNKAIEIDPAYAEAYNNLGASLFNKKKYGMALAQFNKALSVEPDYPEAYRNIAIIYEIKGEHAKVIEFCKKALELDPKYAQAYADLGSAYGALGNFKKAIEYSKKSITIDPSLAVAHNNLAVAYFYTGQYGLSVKHADKAIKFGYKINGGFLDLIAPYRK